MLTERVKLAIKYYMEFKKCSQEEALEYLVTLGSYHDIEFNQYLGIEKKRLELFAKDMEKYREKNL